MKRYGRLWGLICNRDNIEKAADNALKNKKITAERQRFIDNRKELLDKLEYNLINENYKFSFLKYFTVYEPKERVIHHSPFYPDKIIHHAVMNICQKIFIEKFTSDAYGSIKGRGLVLANKKLQKAIRDFEFKYFVQIDITKFYQSVDHNYNPLVRTCSLVLAVLTMLTM